MSESKKDSKRSVPQDEEEEEEDECDWEYEIDRSTSIITENMCVNAKNLVEQVHIKPVGVEIDEGGLLVKYRLSNRKKIEALCTCDDGVILQKGSIRCEWTCDVTKAATQINEWIAESEKKSVKKLKPEQQQ